MTAAEPHGSPIGQVLGEPVGGGTEGRRVVATAGHECGRRDRTDLLRQVDDGQGLTGPCVTLRVVGEKEAPHAGDLLVRRRAIARGEPQRLHRFDHGSQALRAHGACTLAPHRPHRLGVNRYAVGEHHVIDQLGGPRGEDLRDETAQGDPDEMYGRAAGNLGLDRVGVLLDGRRGRWQRRLSVPEEVRGDDRTELCRQRLAHRVPEPVVDAERVQQHDSCHVAISRGGSRGAPSGGGVAAAFIVMASVV